MREFTDRVQRGETADPPSFQLPGEMLDSGAVFVTCPRGHESAVVYNHHRYEVLFTSGTAALEDGYANEAVSTMAAALERAGHHLVSDLLGRGGDQVSRLQAAIGHQPREGLLAEVSHTLLLGSWIIAVSRPGSIVVGSRSCHGDILGAGRD